MGRPRKFKLGDIAYVTDTRRYVAVVSYKTTRTFREYRVIPLDAKYRRAGRAYWIRSARLESTDMKSKGSVTTWRANEWLDGWLGERSSGGRGCACHCCCHEAMPLSDFTKLGEWIHR